MKKFFIINERAPIVVLDGDLFQRLLMSVPQKILIEEFAGNKSTKKGWRKTEKSQIINQIFIEFEI